jgi:outer membrane protein assembly factor BamB
MFTRRRLTDLGVCLSLAAALLVAPAAAQPSDVKPGKAKPGPRPGDAPGTAKPISPPVPDTAKLIWPPVAETPAARDLRRHLETAEDAVREEDWATATAALQGFLDRDEDALVRVTRKVGNKEVVDVSLKQEARRLLASLPAAGREFYATKYGPVATDMLKRARAKNDSTLLRRVAESYLYTDAGPDALQDLAALHADRGRVHLAVLYYEQLLQHRGLARWTPAQLFHAAAAFRAAGERDGETAVTRELLGRAAAGAVQVGKQFLTRDELRKELDKLPARGPLASWPMPGGDPGRNAQGVGGSPFLEKSWEHSLTRTQEVRAWLKDAEKRMQDRGVPVIPAAVPITATAGDGDNKVPLVVFRSQFGVHAADLQTGKLKWETPSQVGLDRMVRNTKMVANVSQWVNAHMQVRPNILLENSTVGTLSTDGASVFAVEDLGVPPANVNPYRYDPQGRGTVLGGELDDRVAASRLQAYDLARGKLRWEVGGHDEKAVLRDCLFLGPPLPLDGRLYAVVETAAPRPLALLLACPAAAAPSLRLSDRRELRLVTLDAATGKLLASRSLGEQARPPAPDAVRRTQALLIAYGKGVLVCPTNVGAVVGVDLLSGEPLWSYTYRDANKAEEAPNPRRGVPPGWVQGPDGRWYNPNTNTQWKTAPPVVVGDKVVFTATDSDKVHCVNLKDGSPVWAQPRKADDLYLAGVFADRVVLVGKGYARAVSLARGEDVWRVETGTPSGYGAASDNVYYLPLRETAKSKEPEVCAINVEKGQVVAHARSRKKLGEEAAAVPGNLVFFRGEMLSQTATEIASYPQLAERLKLIGDALSKNSPNDPEGLYARALLRLDRGDAVAAAEDLRAALATDPPPDVRARLRAKLYDALTEALQRDFDKAEKYLKDYEELCPPPAADDPTGKKMTAEARQRRSDFLVLVGTGREKQGKLAEALERYLDLAALDNGELVPLVSDPAVKVRRDVWAGGRIDEMMRKATPEQRKELEEEMLKRWARDKGQRR